MMFRIMLVAVLAVACGGKTKTGEPAQTTLYDRLGRQDAIKKVVDDFVANVSADAAINKRFEHADVPKLKAMLVDQICAAASGPCKYTGKTMKDAHQGMAITNDEFDALVGDLKKALDANKVGAKEQQELLGAIAPMKTEIVGQ
jgi:hemoglobin